MRAPVVRQVQQVWVLDQGSTIPESRDFTWRNHSGPQQGERGLGLETTNVYVRGTKFPWVGGLLSKVHPEHFQDCKTDHHAVEERKQVHLEWCLWWSLQGSEEVADHIACVNSAWHHQALRCLLWCLWYWFRRCLNAKRSSDIILLMTTKAPWRALLYSWPWVSGSGDGIGNKATLSTWKCDSYLYELQKLKVYLYPTRFEHEAAKVTRVDQGLRARSSLSPREGKHYCGRIESQGSLQLLVGCMIDWRRVQHPCVT
jgi:hypothetical protein